MKTQTLLVVDDEAAIRELLATTLSLAGFEVMVAEDAQQALALIHQTPPDLVLLDWMLPGRSGLALARQLKQHSSTAQLPIILLTAKGDEEDKIQGLDAGADDYVTKPFSGRELISRVKAVLRRSTNSVTSSVLDYQGLSLDVDGQRLYAHGELLSLGPTEFRLLSFLMLHPERAYSRQQLLDLVWGHHVYVEDRTIDVCVGRLRKCLEPYGFAGFVQTVRGLGYRFSTQKIQTTSLNAEDVR